ncbi:CPBP family intramembrane glutamic endopeptidase [Nesterenkonia halotolerans]|uniref:CPBP family intramembrane glutamic endopeptidase n=1 Tax=Nesterenkonia halotolerans TaxID=225325 RepID=UPI003EE7AD18
MTSPVEAAPAVGEQAPSLKLAGRAALWIIGITALVFGGTLALLFIPENPDQLAVPAIVLAVIVHAVLVLVALRGVVRRSDSSWRVLGFVRPSWRLLHLLWQVPVVILAALTVQLVTSLLTGGANDDAGGSMGDFAVGIHPAFAILAFLAIAVLTPLWEEMFFRGLLFGGIRSRWGVVLAILITTALFSVVHAVLVLVPYFFTLGLGLVLLRIFHRNLWGPLVLHVTINSIASATILTALV